MPVGRHRHAIDVRTDGLASVLGPLLLDPAVQAALLVDVDSGMVLDACGLLPNADQEQLGAAHADLLRPALGPAFGTGSAAPSAGDCEIVVRLDGGRHLVMRRVPDPFGDRLGLSVLVAGPPRAVRRARRRLRGVVSAAALTAGPSVALRPVGGNWVTGVTADRPAPPVRPRPLPTGSTPEGPAAPAGEPVGGSALAALDAPRPATPRTRPVDVVPGGPRSVPAAVGPLFESRPPAEPRPAPPSALPPPAQRGQSD